MVFKTAPLKGRQHLFCSRGIKALLSKLNGLTFYIKKKKIFLIVKCIKGNYKHLNFLVE